MFICICPCCPIYTYIPFSFPVNCTEYFKNEYSPAIAAGMRSKHHGKDKYDVGVSDVMKLIECYNPEVSKAILRCGMPFLTARKIVRRLINLSIKDGGSDYYQYTFPPFTDYLC